VYFLSKFLEKEPNCIPHIYDILIKFRKDSFVLVADIEKAFHQITIDWPDREMLHFHGLMTLVRRIQRLFSLDSVGWFLD